MAVSIEDIKKLRTMTGAGMMDCKNALAETEGDIQAAIEIIRKKGQAVAAKREDREASEGCVVAATKPGFGAIVALKCETDFVAKNESFRTLTQTILDAAVAAEAKSLDEVKALKLADGRSIEEHITDEIGKTGEKMELGEYAYIVAPSVASYIHLNNKLATLVGFNLDVDAETGKEVAMQVAAMNPVAVNREAVPASVIEEEKSVAIEKTKKEQVDKAVAAALKKAGLNPNHFDSDDHIASNITKGWITEEDAAKAREIMAATAEQKAASMPQAMIDNIVNGRINKYYKENVLLEQEYTRDATLTVGQFLDKVQGGLVAVEFKRVNLNQD